MRPASSIRATRSGRDAELVATRPRPPVYATTWADRAAVGGIGLLVPAAALSEAWQQIWRHDAGHVEPMRDLLAWPMVLIEALDKTEAAHAGELVDGRDLDSDMAAAQVATCARARDWPVLAAQAARLRVIDPELTVETLSGMS
jgi:hypothetical protein